MKYGIRDGMLRASLDTMFMVARDMGFDGIEYCIGGDYRDSLLWQAGGPEKLRALADDAGMGIASLSPGVYSSMNPAIEDSEKRAEGLKMMTHVIEVCPILDTEAILVPMFPRDFDEWSDSKWKGFINGLKPMLEVAEKHRIMLALETMFSADQIGMVVDKLDSPFAKVYYDTGNMTNRGYDAPAEIRQLSDRIAMIHAKDTDGKMLGEGRVDFKSVSEAIRDIGYDGYIVLETPVRDDPKVDNLQNLAFIRNLGK